MNRSRISMASGTVVRLSTATLCLMVGLFHATQAAFAQPYAVGPPVARQYVPDWGDPYQLTPDGSPAAVSPTAGRLFGGGRLFNGRVFGGNDNYVPPPTATQLNAPVVVTPMEMQPPIVQNGPVPSRFGNWQPMFPRVRERIDTRLYLRTDYLMWRASGMDAPALVTTSPNGTPEDIAGVLGESGTSVLFGATDLNSGSVGGFLFGSGYWMDPAHNFALESEYFALADRTQGYNGSSDGSVILARPFFDVVGGQETALLVSYPSVVNGEVRVSTKSSLRSILLNARMSLCPTHGVCCQQCGMRDRTDWIIGYRNIRQRDSINIDDYLVSQLTSAPGTVTATDQFQTTNEIQGLQLGMIHRKVFTRSWLESTMRVAIANNRQTLNIGGSTTYEESGVQDTFSGGLLAQRTNIGTHKRDEFTMVPELGIRWGTRLSDRVQVAIGYSMLYLPNIVRASEQIDTDLNPGLIPEEVDPLVGSLRPRVLWVETDYLAHGLNFSGEFHF